MQCLARTQARVLLHSRLLFLGPRATMAPIAKAARGKKAAIQTDDPKPKKAAATKKKAAKPPDEPEPKITKALVCSMVHFCVRVDQIIVSG